jgi:hypothetical protein
VVQIQFFQQLQVLVEAELLLMQLQQQVVVQVEELDQELLVQEIHLQFHLHKEVMVQVELLVLQVVVEVVVLLLLDQMEEQVVKVEQVEMV